MVHRRPGHRNRRGKSSNVNHGSDSAGGQPPFSGDAAEQPPTPEGGRFPPEHGSLNHTSREVYQDPSLHQSSVPRTEPPIAALKIEAPTIPLGTGVPSSASSGSFQLPLYSIPAPAPQAPFGDPIAKQQGNRKRGKKLKRKPIEELVSQEKVSKGKRRKARITGLEGVQEGKGGEGSSQHEVAGERLEAEGKADEERKLVEDKLISEKDTEAKGAAEEGKSKKENETTKRLLNPSPGAHDGAREQPQGASTLPTASQGKRTLQPMQNRSRNRSSADPGSPKDQHWKDFPIRNNKYTSQSGPSDEVANQWEANGVGNGTLGNRYPGFSRRPRPPQRRDKRRLSRDPTPPSSNRGGISQEDRVQAVSRWNALPEKLVEEEAEQRKKSREEYLARQAEEALTGVKRAPLMQPKIVETWRKVELNDDRGKVNREFVIVQKIQHEETEATSMNTAAGIPEIPPPGIKKEGSFAESQPQDHRMPRPQNIPTGPAASLPRFTPPAANQHIAQHLGSGAEGRGVRSSLPGSPLPSMSAENPEHGDIRPRAVQPPPPLSWVPKGVPPPGPHVSSKPEQPMPPRVTSGTQGFKVVKQKILGMTQRHSPTQKAVQVQSSPVTQFQPRPLKTVAPGDLPPVRPLLGEFQEGAVSGPTAVSPPCQTDGGDDWLNLLDPDSLSVLSKPDDQELLFELFDHDIGSSPAVKIPYLPPQIFPDDLIRWIPVAPKEILRPPIWCQPQTKKIFWALCAEGFTSERGRRFILVRLPEGTPVEVPYRGVGRGVGPRRGYPQQRYRGKLWPA